MSVVDDSGLSDVAELKSLWLWLWLPVISDEPVLKFSTMEELIPLWLDRVAERVKLPISVDSESWFVIITVEELPRLLDEDVAWLELNRPSVVSEADINSESDVLDSERLDNIVGVPVNERVEASSDVNKDSLRKETLVKVDDPCGKVEACRLLNFESVPKLVVKPLLRSVGNGRDEMKEDSFEVAEKRLVLISENSLLSELSWLLKSSAEDVWIVIVMLRDSMTLLETPREEVSSADRDDSN